MLNNISDSYNNNNIKEQAEILKAGLSLYKNNQSSSSLSQLVDETDISPDALKLYEREQDINQFTQLTLSDPDDTSHNQLAINTLFSNAASMQESDITNSLLNNSDFLKDVLG